MPRERAPSTKASKSSKSPSSGWIASWPPASAPIPVGRSGVAFECDEGVVLPLAVRHADWVDRSQVDDVEAHIGDAFEFIGGGLQSAGDPSAVGALEGAGRTGKNLVPGAAERSGAGNLKRVGA